MKSGAKRSRKNSRQKSTAKASQGIRTNRNLGARFSISDIQMNLEELEVKDDADASVLAIKTHEKLILTQNLFDNLERPEKKLETIRPNT